MIGIIGGSGFYSFLDRPEKRNQTTPFGDASYQYGEVEGHEIAFIPRHGTTHSLPPAKINYRANIFLAHSIGVDKIYASNAVGSVKKEIQPGTFAVPDQILDFTNCREDTFFDGNDFAITTKKGNKLSGVVHTDVTHPFDATVRNEILQACKTLNETVVDGGTIVVVNGPRYETPAEIDAYRILGASYAGMTSSPEAFLAKELEIPYATLAFVTNYAAGMQSKISHEEVDSSFKSKMKIIKQLFTLLITK